MFFRKQPLHKLSEDDLIRRYRKNGDKEVVGELYKRYMHLIYGVCMKYLKDSAASEDAVMEIFEQVMQDLQRFEVRHFSGWLHKITRNHCFMLLRKQQSAQRRQEQFQSEQDLFVESGDGMHHNDKEAEWQAVEKALQTLKEEQRRCLELFYRQEKCYEEVAELTGYSLKQVKSYLQNGRRNLKLQLSQQDGREE